MSGSKPSTSLISNIINYTKEYIWPIERSETSKFLSITLLMFCILFVQNLIRALKDSIINTMIGTETISFLKVWGVMPAAFLMAILYIRIVNSMKGTQIFTVILGSFLTFFALFGFVFLPNHEFFHLSPATTSALVSTYPHFKWFILLIAHWSFSLFYIIAELWPNVVFSLLFWQFVNKITSVEQSKRFYLLFGLLGQTGLYFSGQVLSLSKPLSEYLKATYQLSFSHSVVYIQLILAVVLVLGVTAIIAFLVINRNFATDIEITFKAKGAKMPLKDSIKMIMESRYIRLIAILLICYGIAINLVEGPWKYKARQMFPTASEYGAFVGQYLSYTGLFTISFVLIGSNIVRHLGWFAAAIITPIMVFVTGTCFFLFANFESSVGLMLSSFVLSDPLTIAVVIGAIQNVLSKSSKYTLFDATKEMSYVPLSDELKTKGKAAADVVGVKLGKSLSALLQASIFIIVPHATYQSISLYLMVVFTIICIIWIWAVVALGKEYNNKVAQL